VGGRLPIARHVMSSGKTGSSPNAEVEFPTLQRRPDPSETSFPVLDQVGANARGYLRPPPNIRNFPPPFTRLLVHQEGKLYDRSV